MRAGSAAETDARAAAAGTAHEQERTSRYDLVGCVAGDVERQQEMSVEGAARLLEVQVEEAPVGRPAGRQHHVVDRGRQVTEELLEGSRIGSIEGRSAQSVELDRGASEGLGIPAGKDQLGPLSACSPGRFKPDTGATADHDDGLPEQFRFTLNGRGVGCGAHDSSK